MKRFIWFAIFTWVGIFLINFTFPNIGVRQSLTLVLGIQFISMGLDCLDHFNKNEK